MKRNSLSLLLLIRNNSESEFFKNCLFGVVATLLFLESAFIVDWNAFKNLCIVFIIEIFNYWVKKKSFWTAYQKDL